MRYATVLVALVVGCATVDDPPGLIGGTVEVSTDAVEGLRVIGPEYKMAFSPAGIHLPNHLTVNGGELELLGTQECGENLVGVAVRPAVSVAAGMPHGADAVRSEISAPLTG